MFFFKYILGVLNLGILRLHHPWAAYIVKSVTPSGFILCDSYFAYRGSYMSAHVLLKSLNELRKKIKCEACRAFISFSQRVLDSIYHKSFRLL